LVKELVGIRVAGGVEEALRPLTPKEAVPDARLSEQLYRPRFGWEMPGFIPLI